MIYSVLVNGTRIETTRGDITLEKVDAIVNAANEACLGGGGVDGAIHRAAGNELYEECLELNGCKTGDAKITKGYKLPAKHVIHTVGPIYYIDTDEAPKLLASCYNRSLQVAVENGVKTISFPAISCGVYRYPLNDAAHVAFETVINFVNEFPGLELVRFVLFDETTCEVFSTELKKLSG